ncbi:DEAD/DEAH box helicase [Sphingobacterium sp. 1.A.5]|uniref:DEAD/DEAH box helicase n=1 Tax=Sphingobacterium sp. 1.A.5 TaxID=2044604 RepID=UPI000C0BF04A|nr:DEAD/DEAH box helicase family protein [Sphingobacterium sp. 1.A.5]
MAKKIIKSLLSLNIWDHQKDAITNISEYLKSKSEKSYLVKMPTGTGKTGVFATLTRIVYPKKNYIIVTPSTSLRDQIIAELKDRFWNKIGYDLTKLQNQIIEDLLPSTFVDTYEKIKNDKFIIVTTIQALQSISTNKKIENEFNEFKKLPNCIIFDEGHKEPAYTWGETIRSFKIPTILFSATPYRNDYKIFNIDKNNFFALEHKYSVSQNFLRNLEIKSLNPNPYNTSTFLNDLLSEVNKLEPVLVKQGINNPKIIIRCENVEDIKRMVISLKKLKKRVLGIHENLPKGANYSKQIPPHSEQSKYDFYIHQYKLIEGIDNPDFCIVAIYSDFKSTRLLIQQIGRVLRNPQKLKDQIAYLFCRNVKSLNDEWTKYLKYDSLLTEKKKLFDVTDILKVNKEVETLYFSGTFRELVDVTNINLKESILFQKKINAYIHDGTVDFEELCSYLFEEWESRDYHILKHQSIDSDTLLVLYIKYENSPLVKNGVFIEQTLALTFLKIKGNYIYFYDSIQSSPMRQLDNLKPLNREYLIKLFKDKRAVNKIFLMNTDIGSNNIRNKELQAGAIEYTAPGLSDYSYFPARIEGSISDSQGNYAKRYVGFQNGRITDFTNARIEYDEFIEWINGIHQEINTNTTNNKINSFMGRFSEKVDAPLNPTPTSILLDIDDEIIYRYGYEDSKKDVVIEDYCALITNNEFVVEINNEEFAFTIVYDSNLERFYLSCTDINDKIQPLNPNEQNLLSYINNNQCFRLVLEGNKYIYAHKNFFTPSLNINSKKQNLDINQLFNPYSCISTIRSEKGHSKLKISNNLWNKNTLFGLIARQAKGYDKKLESEFNFDYLLCDDLGSEIGDFIGLDIKNKRVVFIHAKAKKSKLSASNFTEVCGQATKNLDFLTPYYQRVPKQNIDKWKNPWSLKNVGQINNRVITNNATPQQFWNLYMKLISDPTTSREVWLMVGNMFDINTFKKELNKKDISKVKSEAIQLIYLIRSTWNSVSQVGAKLKIYC